jgi:putative transposase
LISVVLSEESEAPESPDAAPADDYRRGRHVVSALNAHIVFVTKYRRGVISDRARETLHQSVIDVCADFSVRLKAFDGEDDHIHMLVEYPPTVALSRLVNSLKGVSSRRLRQRKYPEVDKKLWGGHFWSPSYFVASCGGAPLDVIKAYVENQRSEKKKGKKPLTSP